MATTEPGRCHLVPTRPTGQPGADTGSERNGLRRARPETASLTDCRQSGAAPAPRTTDALPPMLRGRGHVRPPPGPAPDPHTLRPLRPRCPLGRPHRRQRRRLAQRRGQEPDAPESGAIPAKSREAPTRRGVPRHPTGRREARPAAGAPRSGPCIRGSWRRPERHAFGPHGTLPGRQEPLLRMASGGLARP